MWQLKDKMKATMRRVGRSRNRNETDAKTNAFFLVKPKYKDRKLNPGSQLC
jgi:hypothetical protein